MRIKQLLESATGMSTASVATVTKGSKGMIKRQQPTDNALDSGKLFQETDAVEDSLNEGKGLAGELAGFLKSNGFKGPYRLGKLPKWAADLSEFDKSSLIMVQGNDVEYDEFILDAGFGELYMGGEGGITKMTEKAIMNSVAYTSQGVAEAGKDVKDIWAADTQMLNILLNPDRKQLTDYTPEEISQLQKLAKILGRARKIIGGKFTGMSIGQVLDKLEDNSRLKQRDGGKMPDFTGRATTTADMGKQIALHTNGNFYTSQGKTWTSGRTGQQHRDPNDYIKYNDKKSLDDAWAWVQSKGKQVNYRDNFNQLQTAVQIGSFIVEPNTVTRDVSGGNPDTEHGLSVRSVKSLSQWSRKREEQGVAEGFGDMVQKAKGMFGKKPSNNAVIPQVVAVLGKLVSSRKLQAAYDIDPDAIEDIEFMIDALKSGDIKSAAQTWRTLDSDFTDDAIESFVQRNGLPNVRLDDLFRSQGVAEGFPKDPNAPKLVRDRKTGKQYDPNKEFEKKMTSPDVMAQMKRMAKKEGVAEANIQPTGAKSRSHIGNLSNPTTNSVVHPSSGKEIGSITQQPNGEFYAHPSSTALAHSQGRTFATKDEAHQFIRNAHANAVKNGTLSKNWLKSQPLPQFAKDQGVAEGFPRIQAARKKYGDKGLEALKNKKANGAGEKTMQTTRDEHDKYDEGVAGPKSCWPGHRKVGTQPGTGKNKGKPVNDCEKIKKEDVDESRVDELSKDTLKQYIPRRIEKTKGLAKTDYDKAHRIIKKDIPRAMSKYKDPNYGKEQPTNPVEENKKGVRAVKHTTKPRNFVAKNAVATTSGAGAHKDKKKAMKQGDVKHKGKEPAYESKLWAALDRRIIK